MFLIALLTDLRSFVHHIRKQISAIRPYGLATPHLDIDKRTYYICALSNLNKTSHSWVT